MSTFYPIQDWTINRVFQLVSMGTYLGKVFRELQRNEWLTQDQLETQQLVRLQSMLAYVYEQVPFYRRIMQTNKTPPEYFTTLDHLQDFPILSKTLIRENLDELTAQDFPARKRVLNATGGSTARPILFYHSPAYTARLRAGSLRGAYWTGWRVGKGWARVWGADTDVKVFRKQWGKLLGYAQRRLIIPSWEFSDETLPVFLRQIQRFQPYMIEGYRSALRTLARASIECNRPLHPIVVISSAETLTPDDRECLENTWDTRVFNRYGSREFGTISHECDHGRMHMSTDEYIVETVEDDGSPVSNGETGEVLITTLTNWVMPLVRYAIEDRAALSDDRCPCGRGLPLMERIEGRTSDILRLANGRKIDGFLFFRILKYHPIIEFQVEQRAPDTCTISIIPSREFTDTNREEITTALAKALGPDTHISVQCVEQLKSTQSGKYRRIIGYQEAEANSD